MDKNDLILSINDMFIKYNMNTKDINEICFALMYTTLLSEENKNIQLKEFGVDVLNLSGEELVDYVYLLSKAMVMSNESNDTEATKEDTELD